MSECECELRMWLTESLHAAIDPNVNLLSNGKCAHIEQLQSSRRHAERKLHWSPNCIRHLHYAQVEFWHNCVFCPPLIKILFEFVVYAKMMFWMCGYMGGVNTLLNLYKIKIKSWNSDIWTWILLLLRMFPLLLGPHVTVWSPVSENGAYRLVSRHLP